MVMLVKLPLQSPCFSRQSHEYSSLEEKSLSDLLETETACFSVKLEIV